MTFPIGAGSIPAGTTVPAAGAIPPAPPAPIPQAPATPPPNPNPPSGAADPADEPLRAEGLRALQSEREARKEAERVKKELETKLQEYQLREMTEAQQAQAAAAQWEQRYQELSVTTARATIALEYGITGEDVVLLTANTETELRAQAERVKNLIAGRTVATTPPAFAPNPGQASGNGEPPASTATVESGMALWKQRNQKS